MRPLRCGRPERRPFPSGGEYEIHVREEIDTYWSAWLDGVRIEHDPNGGAVLTGYVADQAGLHSLLMKIRDMQLTILSLRLITTDESPAATSIRPERDGQVG